jgi:hypothetical protein
LPINVNSESLAYPFDDVVDSNFPCDLQEKEVLFDEYFDLDGIESHSLQSEIHANLGSIDSHAFPLLSKHKSIYEHSDVFNFYSHNSFQVSNDTHSNIQLEACFDKILLELFSSGNFILVNDHWSTGCLTNFRFSKLDDCVHMTITLENHTSSFFFYVFQYPPWEEVSSFKLLGTKQILLILLSPLKQILIRFSMVSLQMLSIVHIKIELSYG